MSAAGLRSLSSELSPPDPELVFALVSPTGTHLSQVQDTLSGLLKQYGYETLIWRLSDMAKEIAGVGDEVASKPEFDRIRSLQEAGNRIRREAGRGDVLALHAIARILRKRSDTGNGAPFRSKAHILRSLKHPDEVEALRRVYGVGFFLIGVHASHDERVTQLTDMLGLTDEQAAEIMEIDESEDDDEFGQQTRRTFHQADVFIRDGESKQLRRFLQLVFGSPFETPTPDEHAMFLAYASAMRSAQPGRQVGAVIVSATGEVIATGANDVPKYGGGLYWSEPARDDQRDHKYKGGMDSNRKEIGNIIGELVAAIKPQLNPATTMETIKELWKNSRLHDLTEFGRAVHAEMEALMACARIGVSPAGGRLFTTTFPCHNCAKHIVDAGISEVLFVEPYPKSRASQLHEDSIAVDDPSAKGKVRFLPFVGVAARRYFDLFSMKLGSGDPLRRRSAEGGTSQWKPRTASPRVRMSPYSYIGRERVAVAQIPVQKPDDAPASPLQTNPSQAADTSGNH